MNSFPKSNHTAAAAPARNTQPTRIIIFEGFEGFKGTVAGCTTA